MGRETQNELVKESQDLYLDLCECPRLLIEEHKRIFKTLEDKLKEFLISTNPEMSVDDPLKEVGIKKISSSQEGFCFEIPEYCSYHDLQREGIGNIGSIGIYTFPIIGYCNVAFKLPMAGIREVGGVALGWLDFKDLLAGHKYGFVEGDSGSESYCEGYDERIMKEFMKFHFKEVIEKMDKSKIHKAKQINNTDFDGLMELSLESYETQTLPYREVINQVSLVYEKLFHPKNFKIS